MGVALPIPSRKIEAFCRKWRIAEVCLFGSVLRDDFGPDSDVDVMVSFRPDADWGLLDLARMQEELEGIFGRNVDLLTRRGVERSHNRIRREAILRSAEPIYAAG